MSRIWLGLAVVALGVAIQAGGVGMDLNDLPKGLAADEGKSVADEIENMQDWVSAALLNKAFPRDGRVHIVSAKQDHSALAFGESCIGSPMRIGTQDFAHGLGTHACSEIVFLIPENATAFRAMVGVDNNGDTQGTRGSVVFSVEADGKELYKSGVARGGEEPLSVKVDLPIDSKKLILKVDTTPDGPGWDQADWGDAQLVMKDGSVLWLDEGQDTRLLAQGAIPFSFKYAGESSASFLADWQPKSVMEVEGDDKAFVSTWTDPETGLRVTVEGKTWKQFPAVDWVLHFENTGDKDTPIIEDIKAVDVDLNTGYGRTPMSLYELEGDACAESTFRPKVTQLEAGKSIHRAPTGGRSSSISAFPFFDVQYRNLGLTVAIGWTGQWASDFVRSDRGPTRMSAGMELTHLVLHPGEKIRTPRIVMMSWTGDRTDAHNRFRRMMLHKYVPWNTERPTIMPVALQTFDRYNAKPGWATEQGQIEAVNKAEELGCDTYWLDAAWFPGNFPNGVGNWFCKPAEFPNGLGPVGKVCADKGMRFVLWFEPERVAVGTQIAEEHPEFVHGGKNGGLFKLDNPEARRWLTELLSKRITEYGITIYRNDFNMDPLDFWRKNDAEDRQGMTEIRYVEGLYEMWDELLKRHPGLLIDNCSSGGRRIDIEMCSRSVPFWRSDTNCFAGNAVWSQMHSVALGQYVPLSTACVWEPTRYAVRSASTSGLLCQFAYQDPSFPFEDAKSFVAEANANRKYWYGDMYPLTGCGTEKDQFMAFQMHRPDLGAGVVCAFRRAECPLRGIIAEIKGIEPDKRYKVQATDESGNVKSWEASGEDLAGGLELRIPKAGESEVVTYQMIR